MLMRAGSFSFYKVLTIKSQVLNCVLRIISTLMQNKNASGCLSDFPCHWKNCCPQVACNHYITHNVGQCGMELEKTRDKKANGGFLQRLP